MMMKIRNFRRIREINMDVGGIMLVAGHNEQGKSSLIQAFAACLMQEPMVMSGLHKKDAKMLINGGKRAVVSLGDKDKVGVSVTWPDCQVGVTGNPFKASHIATGMTKFTRMSVKERSDLLIETLSVMPSERDFKMDIADSARNANIAVDAAWLNLVWEEVQEHGYDIVSQRRADHARDLKREWTGVTSEVWGHLKAEKWLTENADKELSKTDIEALRQSIAFKKTRLVAREKRRWLAEHTKEEMEERFALHSIATTELLALNKKLHDDRAALQLMRDKHAALKSDMALAGASCPHCEKPLYVREGKILRLDQSYDVEALAKEAEELIAQGKKLSKAIEVLEKDIATQQLLIEEAEKARLWLDEHEKLSDASDIITEEDIAAMEWKLRAAIAYDAAHDFHLMIMQSVHIAAELAPNGIRLRHLQKRLNAFNEGLKDYSKVLGMEAVHIEDDMSVWRGRLPYMFLSSAAQFLTDFVIQIAIAGVDGSDMILVDGADILQAPGRRTAIIQSLINTGVPCVITMSLNTPDSAPDLFRAGVGASYWMQDGALTRIRK